MKEVTALPQEIIFGKIYEVRGVKVMIDRDLAQLYSVKSIRLHEQVKRNVEKFPAHFMFKLTEEEANNLVSQKAIPTKKNLDGSLSYVFTEHSDFMFEITMDESGNLRSQIGTSSWAGIV